MKLSISIYNYIAKVATNVLSISNVTVRGTVGCMVADSFSASLQLTHNHMESVSNIADTENPWVLIGKNKRPCCTLILLSSDWLTFPTYLMSTSYISFPLPSPDSCLGYSALPS